MAAELIRCVYWFNPLLWIACRRLRDDSEQACDDAVLNRGVGATDYATHLLEVARASARRRTLLPAPALAIARRPTLERRITAMLNARLTRTPITRSACVATVAAFLAVTIPISGFGRAAQNAPATFSGTLFDAIGRVLPEVPITLTNISTTSKQDARSDQAGHFSFTGLAAGTYELDTDMPGFAARYRLTLGAGQSVQRDVALQLGSIQETITVWGGGGAPATPQTVRRARVGAEPGYTCGESSPAGCIDMPIKRKDVKPLYPPHLEAARRGGVVLLEGHIGVDGLLNGLHVVAPVDPDFANAALDAVRQWEFRPTRLDGVTVETRINIAVNFKAGN
jgi:TonB family protein